MYNNLKEDIFKSSFLLETIIAFNCPSVIEKFIEFACNVSMALSPPAGYKNYNITVIIGSDPVTYMNSVFNTSSKLITGRVDSIGEFDVIVYENNYNTQIAQKMIVKQSNT